MGSSSIAVALALAALAVHALTLGRPSVAASGAGRSPGVSIALLGLLAIVSMAAHTGVIDRDRDTRALMLRVPPLHLQEYFHYFLGTRYFAELGHDRLYEAVVIADYEAEPRAFRALNRFRDLKTNVVDRVRGDVIREGSLARRSFSEARWSSFSDDVALLRGAAPSRHDWHGSWILRDHGYNGTPLVTALLGTIANQEFVDSATFMQNLRWFDLVLIAAFAAWVGQLFGATAGLGFLVLFLVNPLNDYRFIGGCYLRYGFVLSLGAAWVSLQRDHRIAAGVWLAVACHFRVFPVFFALGLLLWDLAQPERLKRLHEDARLFAAFAGTGVALLLATAWVQDPQGRSVWIGFTERLAVHTTAYATNGAGLTALFAYSADHGEESVAAAVERGEAENWEDRVGQTVARRAPARWAATAALLAATLACARHLPRRYALFLGFPLVFTLLYLSHYYYCFLGLLALVFRDDRPALLTLAGFSGLLLLCTAPTSFTDPSLRYAALSAVLLAMALALGAVAARPGRRDQRGAPARPSQPQRHREAGPAT